MRFQSTTFMSWNCEVLAKAEDGIEGTLAGMHGVILGLQGTKRRYRDPEKNNHRLYQGKLHMVGTTYFGHRSQRRTKPTGSGGGGAEEHEELREGRVPYERRSSGAWANYPL